MSDVTELAQRMKAAAIRAKSATEDYVANRTSMSVCLSESAELNDLSDGPDNIIALVEALEARDKQIAEHNFENRLLASADRDIKASRQRITELEARTVKLPLPRRKTADDYADGTFEPCDLAAIYNACRLKCEVKFKKALDAAGVAVERN